MAIERVLSNLNLISFKTEEGLQNHIDELQDGDLVFTPDNSLKGNLFDFKWTDHKLDDMSWLNADTFSWQSGDVYVAAYEHLVDDLTNATARGLADTINGYTVFYDLAPDGHKIINASYPDNITAAENIYNSTGVAWYYILDTENKRFKLPRTKYGFTGLRDEVGNYVPESLPTHTHTRGSMNITGDIGWGVNTLGDPYAGGAFTVNYSTKNALNHTADDNSWYVDFGFDASRAWTGSTSEPDNGVYGSGKPVQQRATQMYLYFYVGNFEQSAVEQTAGLNAELFNGKADRDLKNLPSNYDYVVATQEPTSANGYTWFRKYKSGWVEQGGRAVIYDGEVGPNRYDAKDISIPVPMKHCTNWHCQARHDRFNAGIGQDNITTTAHIYQVNDSTNTFVNKFVIWEISGYAA